jgi:O-antigen/teichoic acid export membrane protein
MPENIKKTILRLVAHPNFNKYFFNTLWIFSENALRMTMSLLVGIWVARYLGPTSFGIFSFSLAVAAIFTSITKFGMDEILIRDLLLKSDKYLLYLGTAFWIRVIGSTVLLLILIIGLTISSNDYLTNIYILIIASASIFQSFEIIDFYFQSQTKSKITSICRLAQLLISSVVKIYLMKINADLIWFVLVVVLDQITLAIALLLAYSKQKIQNFFYKFNLSIARSLLKDGLPQIISGIAIITYIRIDQILINYYLGAQETGIYSAAVRLSEVWYVIPVLLTQSLFPSLINSKKNQDIYNFKLSCLYTFLVIVTGLLAVTISINGEWIVVNIYGKVFEEAASVLIIHIWGGVFVALGVVGGKVLINENMQYLLISRAIFGVIINIVLSIILIPKYGIIGAAGATLIAIIFSSYLMDFFNKKTKYIFYQKTKALFLVQIYDYLFIDKKNK